MDEDLYIKYLFIETYKIEHLPIQSWSCYLKSFEVDGPYYIKSSESINDIFKFINSGMATLAFNELTNKVSELMNRTDLSTDEDIFLAAYKNVEEQDVINRFKRVIQYLNSIDFSEFSCVAYDDEQEYDREEQKSSINKRIDNYMQQVKLYDAMLKYLKKIV